MIVQLKVQCVFLERFPFSFPLAAMDTNSRFAKWCSSVLGCCTQQDNRSDHGYGHADNVLQEFSACVFSVSFCVCVHDKSPLNVHVCFFLLTVPLSPTKQTKKNRNRTISRSEPVYIWGTVIDTLPSVNGFSPEVRTISRFTVKLSNKHRKNSFR